MRLVVDGMNVIGARPDGWWRDRPGAMAALVDRLAGLGEEADVVVVFDGRALPDLPEGLHGGVDVRYASHADDRIAALAEPGVRVVTSDRGLRSRAVAAGAEVVGASWLLDRLG
jgi:predicted RNA-binding protein with PIN domain